MLPYFLFAGLWIAWCTLHSFMISAGVVRTLKENLGDRFRYYRIFYNLVAIVTLVPILFYSDLFKGPTLFDWSGPWRPVQLLLALGALALFYAGGLHYDLRQFLGVRQVLEHEAYKGLTEEGGLDTNGILSLIRHPWYAAGILILWARPLDTAVLVANTVLTSYLVVGAFLEERKLVAEFGEPYREYQEQVPMFFPKFRGKGERD